MALLSTVVLLVLALCTTRVHGQSSTQTDQQRLLAQRYAVTNWDEYYAANNYVGWVDDNTVPVCTWTGVYCNPSGAIEELRFQCPNCAVKAVGTLAQNLSQILTFKTLNVQQQALGGPLPDEFGSNGAFPNLINLLLQQNYFTGTIPASWSSANAFPNVQLMTYQVNNLTGPLPEPVSWPNLQVLRLHQNQFTGTLPGSWGQSLPNVQIISLHQNRLQGSLPAQWAQNGSFQLLEELYLQNNTLKGQLPGPSAAAIFPKLKTLDLSYNNFAGTLPPVLGGRDAVPSLELMYLRSIGLNGTLPASWGAPGHGMNKLRELWLDGNELSGTIPASWSALTSLEMLYVKPGNARLCGPLPPNLPFKICDANGNEFCNMTAALDGPTCPPWNPPPSNEPDGGSSKTGAIVGGVVGGVVGGALLAFAAVFLVRRRRRRQQRMSPFIAEASTALEPSKNDLSGYAKTLLSLEGGGAEPEPDAASWTKRMLQRASSLCGAAGGGAAGMQQAARLPGDPDLGGEGSTLQTPAADQPGGLPAFGSQEGFMFNNSSTLMTTDMSIAASAAAAAAALPPPGAPSGLTTRGRVSHASNFSAQPPTPEEPQLVDLGVQQLSDWEIQPEEIEYMKRPDGTKWELGCGGFGKVYKAMRNGAQPVAVKVLTSGPDARYMAMNEFRREVAILKACRDPNIVAFLGACMRDDCAMLVTEYCEGGNLARNIVARKVNWYRRGRKIALDIAKGLVFLHSRRIVHLDLKSPNILLSRDGTAKIADVGLAKIIAHEYSAVTGAVGTLAWSSPEMLLGARCTEKSDIYSYGVVLWEIATGQTPIRGQLRDVKVPEECTDELRKLMLDCLEQNPRRRPSAPQIIERLKRIPVSPREHAPALPPNMLRPSTPAEAAAEAAAKATAAALAATAAAAAASAAALEAVAEKDAQQVRQDRGGQRRQERQHAGAENVGGHAAMPGGLSPLLASDPSSPRGSDSQAPVSAFAAAAAVVTSTPTPRTASDASELLTGAAGSCLQSPLPVPGGFTGAAIAPAGSLPTPFSNKAAAGPSLLEQTLEKQGSSTTGTQLPAWSSSDELASRDPRIGYDQSGSPKLSRAASGTPRDPAAGAGDSSGGGFTPGRRGSSPLQRGASGSGRASPYAATGGSATRPAMD